MFTHATLKYRILLASVTACLSWICFRRILDLVESVFNFYCLNLFINLHILSPLGVPIRVQNLKDGTVHDKPLDIYLYLNKMGSVEQSVVSKK